MRTDRGQRNSNRLRCWLGATYTAFAAATYSTTADADSYLVRGVDGIADRDLIGLMRIAQPILVTAGPGTGSTALEIVTNTCGFQSKRVAKKIFSGLEELNGPVALGETIPNGVALYVPFCLKQKRNAVVTVEANDTPSHILRRSGGLFGPLTTKAFYVANRARTGASDMHTFNTGLQPGASLVLPYSSPLRLLEERPTAQGGFETVVASIPRDDIAGNLRYVSRPAPDKSKVKS